MVLNGLIAYVLKKHKKTSIVTFWFIYCLSISNVMVGVTGLIYHLLQLLGLEKAVWNIPQMISKEFYRYYRFTSWLLILIIAVDRCIHMKYPQKYSIIATRFRARIIMLFTIVFGILYDLPSNLPLNVVVFIWLQFTLYVFYIVCILAVIAIYLVLYCLIKRRVNALQTCEVDRAMVHDAQGKSIDYQHAASSNCIEFSRDSYLLSVFKAIRHDESIPYNEETNVLEQQANCMDETLQIGQQQSKDIRKIFNEKRKCQCKPLMKDCANECVNMKLNASIGTPSRFDVPVQTRTVKQHDDHPDCLNEILVQPYSKCRCSRKCVKSDDVESVVEIVGYENSSVTVPITATTTSNQRVMDNKELCPISNMGARVNQASRQIHSTPDEEVKKVTFLILITVLVCNVPGHINFFYYFATGTPVYALSFISQLSVLLNSSLNAIILIVWSRDIKRAIKALFVQS